MHVIQSLLARLCGDRILAVLEDPMPGNPMFLPSDEALSPLNGLDDAIVVQQSTIDPPAIRVDERTSAADFPRCAS